MLERFIREQGTDLGMCADVNIHDPYPPGHNPHSHILFTMRPLDEHGKWQAKTQKEYLCKRGEEECCQDTGMGETIYVSVRGEKGVFHPI